MAFQADFHDGFVDGVLVSGSDARIFLRTQAGKQFTLILSEVDAIRVDDFRKGNIVFELNMINPDQVGSDFVFEIYGYSEQYKEGFDLTNWIENTKKAGLKAIELTPSYGCSVSALFEGYELVDGISIT